MALDVGLDADAPMRVAAGAGAAGWSPRQRLLLLAVDELHARRVITDATWGLLEAELSEQEVVELCFVVGHYEMLAMALNTLGVAADPSALARLPPDARQLTDDLRRSLTGLRRDDG